jgi:hypothetical protein
VPAKRGVLEPGWLVVDEEQVQLERFGEADLPRLPGGRKRLGRVAAVERAAKDVVCAPSDL